MQLTLKNVRGFDNTNVFEIRPLTLVVGENSSGKTTLLGAINAVLQDSFPTGDNVFNRAPFDFGGFDTIATFRGGRAGRTPTFSVGWSTSRNSNDVEIQATYTNDAGSVKPRTLECSYRNRKLTVTIDKPKVSWVFQIATASGRTSVVAKDDYETESNRDSWSFLLQEILRRYLTQTRSRQKDHVEELFELVNALSSSRQHVTALAPLRTRPQRTYDALSGDFKPEGDHTPLALSRLLKSTRASDLQRVEALFKFGTESGLYEKVLVKRLGSQASDPFQLRIKAKKGPDVNIVDVGYGVSQSMPIVLESLLAPKGEVVLVQQPEVHLHPRAQAALGSFYSRLIQNEPKTFVIETHSDYLLDRVRLEVSRGTLKPDQVVFLYLEKKGLDTKVHHLTVDKLGNIEGVPPGYRQFFIDEEMRLLTRGAQ